SRDRRDPPLRAAHRAHSAAQPVPREQQPLQHAQVPGTSPDADQQPRHGVTRGGCASRARRLSLLRAQAGSQAPLLHRELPGLPEPRDPVRLRSVMVLLLGHPVAHSLSPRMQNAAFAAAGLDWEYALRDVLPEELEAAVREVEYANVTAPYKLDAARILGSELPSVNTIVRGRGFSTDAAILASAGDVRAAAIVGDGGAAAAFRHALPDARVFSRRGDWPPNVTGADLVIHATPVRDEALFALREGQ